MIVAPYKRDQGVDDFTIKLIKGIRTTIGEKDDDFLLPIVGTTGTGKSRLSLHLYEAYDPEGCSVDYIGLDQKSHAIALQKAKEKDLPRACIHDEANINRQQHARSYNQDLIDLYLAIRGLQIFHVWNNPTATLFPRIFIEERIKGLIYVFTKDKNKPRLFYYFTKANMLKMYDDTKGDLSHRNIKKHAKKYATYRGWFRDYEGVLLKEYENKKLARMDVKVEDFFTKYGSNDLMTSSQLGRELGVSQTTVMNWHNKLGGMMVPDEDYSVTGAGRTMFTLSGVNKLKEYAIEKSSQLGKYANSTPIYNHADSEREAAHND